jgi:hypothetical protein
VEEKR